MPNLRQQHAEGRVLRDRHRGTDRADELEDIFVDVGSPSSLSAFVTQPVGDEIGDRSKLHTMPAGEFQERR